MKSAALMIALAAESFLVTRLLFDYVKTQDYFSFNLYSFIPIGLTFLLILWTYSLTVGGWGKWEQYVLVPLPISLGIFVAVFQLDVTYAPLTALISSILLSYYMYNAAALKKEMVRFRPSIILSSSTKGILFLFSLVAAVLVFLHATSNGQEINLGKTVGEFASEHYAQSLPAEGLGLDLAQIVESEFNKLVAPYQDFILPVTALLVFALVRFIGSLANMTFDLTSRPVYWLFKKVGFLHVSHTTVEKEDIGFEPAKV